MWCVCEWGGGVRGGRRECRAGESFLMMKITKVQVDLYKNETAVTIEADYIYLLYKNWCKDCVNVQ